MDMNGPYGLPANPGSVPAGPYGLPPVPGAASPPSQGQSADIFAPPSPADIAYVNRRSGQVIVEPSVRTSGMGRQSNPPKTGKQNPQTAPTNLTDFADYAKTKLPDGVSSWAMAQPTDLAQLAEDYTKEVYIPHLESLGYKISKTAAQGYITDARVHAFNNAKNLQDALSPKDANGAPIAAPQTTAPVLNSLTDNPLADIATGVVGGLPKLAGTVEQLGGAASNVLGKVIGGGQQLVGKGLSEVGFPNAGKALIDYGQETKNIGAEELKSYSGQANKLLNVGQAIENEGESTHAKQIAQENAAAAAVDAKNPNLTDIQRNVRAAGRILTSPSQWPMFLGEQLPLMVAGGPAADAAKAGVTKLITNAVAPAAEKAATRLVASGLEATPENITAALAEKGAAKAATLDPTAVANATSAVSKKMVTDALAKNILLRNAAPAGFNIPFAANQLGGIGENAYQEALDKTHDPTQAAAAAYDAMTNRWAAIATAAALAPVGATRALSAAGESGAANVLKRAAGQTVQGAAMGGAGQAAENVGVGAPVERGVASAATQGAAQALPLVAGFESAGLVKRAGGNVLRKGAEPPPNPAAEGPAAPGAPNDAISAVTNEALSSKAGNVNPAKATDVGHVKTKFDNAVSQFNTALKAEDLGLTPEQTAQAVEQFTQQWASKNGVKPEILQAATAPKPTAIEEPVTPEQAAEAVNEPVTKAASDEEALANAKAVGAAKEEAGPPAFTQEQLLEQPGIDPRYKDGIAKAALGALQDRGVEHPSGEEINAELEKQKQMHLNALNAQEGMGKVSDEIKAQAINEVMAKEGNPSIDDITKAVKRLQKPRVKVNPLTSKVETTPIAAKSAVVTNLPKDLKGATPKYGLLSPEFASDIDKALYIVRQSAKRSKQDERYMSFLRGHFSDKSDSEIRNMGEAVKKAVKGAASTASNGKFIVPEVIKPPKANAGAAESVPAKSAKEPATQTGSGRTANDIRQELGKTKWGRVVTAALEKAGILHLHDTAPEGIAKEGFTTKGYYDGRAGHLFADQIHPGEAMGVLLHEVGAHYGLRRMLGGHQGALYRGIEKYVRTKLRSTDALDKEAQEIKTAHEAAVKSEPDPRIVLNETIAHMMQRSGHIEGTIWNKALTKIRAFLYKNLGEKLPASIKNKMLSNDVIKELVKNATRSFENETPKESIAAASRAPNTESPAFKQFFGESKVTDKYGAPRVMYHGTGENFDTFDTTKLGEHAQHSSSGLGFFFTGDKAIADKYADRASDFVPANKVVLGGHLKIENPYTMSLKEIRDIKSIDEARAKQAELKAQGYDGIHVPEAKSWIAFSSNQFKELGNRGTYDINEPNIYYSREPTTVEDVRRSAAEWSKVSEPVAIKVQNAVKNTMPDSSGIRGVREFFGNAVNKIAALQHFNEAMARAGKALDDSQNMFRAFTLLKGTQFHKQMEDNAYYISPFKAAIEVEAAKRGTATGKLLDHLTQWLRAKDALETNYRTKLENVRLTEDAEKERSALKEKYYANELPESNYLDELEELVNKEGNKVEEEGNKDVNSLSGIPDDVAHKLLSDLRKEGFDSATGEKLNKLLDPLRERLLQNQQQSGMFTKAGTNLARAYKSKYYVPKSGYADARLSGAAGQSDLGAFNSEPQLQKGRESLAADPLEQLFKKLLYSAKNIADNNAMESVYNAVRARPEDSGATITRYDMDELAHDALKNGGKLREMERISKNPNTVIFNKVLKDGNVIRNVIEFPDNSPVLKAIKDSQTQTETGKALNALGAATTALGRMHTVFSPSFTMASAIVRDSLYVPAMHIMQGYLGMVPRYVAKYISFGGPAGAWAHHVSEFAKFKTQAEALDYAKANPKSYAGMYYQLSKEGGATSFADEFNKVKKVEALRKQIEQEHQSGLNPKKILRKVVELQDALAGGSINAGRVAAFGAGLDYGWSPARSAFESRRLLDYQQSSDFSNKLNKWAAFSRTALNSADAAFTALKNEKGDIDPKRAVIGSMVMGGLAAGAYAALKASLGDKKTKELTDDSLAKNVLISTGSDTPIQLPIGLGLPRVTWGTTMLAVRLAEGDTTAASAGRAFKNLLLENFSPLHPIESKEGADVGTQIGDLLTAFAPTPGTPIIETLRNESHFGTPLHKNPEYTSGFASESGKLATANFWKELAHGLRTTTGMDVYPESLEHLTTSYDPGIISTFFSKLKRDDMMAAGLDPDASQGTIWASLFNHDIKYSGNRDLYRAEAPLDEATKEVKTLKDEGKPIPANLEQKAAEDKKINSERSKFSKELNAIQKNKLMSPEIKAARTKALMQQWNSREQRLTDEATKIGAH